MADLIRNPDSTNLFYIPQSEFPTSSSSAAVGLNDSGEFYVQAYEYYAEAEFPELEEPVDARGKIFFLSENVMNHIIYVNFLFADGGSTAKDSSSFFTADVDGNAVLPLGTLVGSGSNTLTQISLVMSTYYGSVKVGIFDSDGFTGWESAYMEAPTTATVTERQFYQNADGSWPSSPNRTVQHQDEEIGSSFSLSDASTTPSISPASGEYVVDTQRSDSSVIVEQSGTTIDVYFKLQFTVTFRDTAGGNADDTHGELDYGTATPDLR